VNGAELLLPNHMTVRGAGEALAARLPIEDGARCERDRTYYDTFDGLLHGAGLSLMYEEGRLSVVERDTGLVRAGAPMAAPAKPLFVRELPPGMLQDALAPIVDVRALLPLAHLHSREHPIAVLDDERKTVLRLALEEPALIDSGDGETALRPRVRLVGIRGYDEAFARVRDELVTELGFIPTDQPLVDEAVRAAGGVPGGLPAKVSVPLHFDQRADAAAAAVLRALLEVIEANLEGTIDDVDSEFLHDLRVSIRRSRAVQRELKAVFGPAELASFRADFRWLQQATGDARDLDVHVLEFDALAELVPEVLRGDLDPLLRVLRERRAAAHRELAATLRSDRVTSLLARWRSFLDGLEGIDEADRPAAAHPIGAVAGERIRRVYRGMVRMGGAIDESSPAEDYHELRKKGKELRYLLELFGAPLYDAEVVKPMIRTLKALQDVLGRHQDREVQAALIRSLAPEVGAGPGGSEALMAMGALIARLTEDGRAARSEFAGRFAEFAAKEQRRLVKETFAS
jgi:CHAD domain-containing protein